MTSKILSRNGYVRTTTASDPMKRFEFQCFGLAQSMLEPAKHTFPFTSDAFYLRACSHPRGKSNPVYIYAFFRDHASMLAPEEEIEPCAYIRIFREHARKKHYRWAFYSRACSRNILYRHFICEHAREQMSSRVYQTPPTHNQASGEG